MHGAEVPKAWTKQLKVGGVMSVPVINSQHKQHIHRIEKGKNVLFLPTAIQRCF